MIGVWLKVEAKRIGNPAVRYVGIAHPEGPAHQAGLRHGGGTAVSGKSYEQVIKMIRGESGRVAWRVQVCSQKGQDDLPRLP